MPGLTSLQASLFTKTNERKASASITSLRADGSVDGGALRFQYWPDTISDTKSINWNPRDIPGGSLPIYQWINSGERLISFSAMFTCDMDIQGSEKKESNINLVQRLAGVGAQARNVDIRAAVAWLRRFQLPTFGKPADSAVGVPIAFAPPRLILSLPKTGIGLTGGLTPTSASQPDEILAVMTTCDVAYEAFFPSGLPRVATVSLAFAQIAQKAGGGQVNLPSGTDMEKILSGADDSPGKTFGYKLEVKR